MDLEKLLQMKAKLESQLSRGGGGPKANFWQAKSGDNRLRLLPSWTNEGPHAGSFWREVSQHWGVSEDMKGPVICAQKTPDLEGNCPVCEFVDYLKAQKDNPAAAALAYELRAKKAFFLNIVDLDDAHYTAQDVKDYIKENEGKDPWFKAGQVKIQCYAAPITVFDAILGVMTKTKKDITNLTTGRSLTLTKHVTKGNSMLTRYEVVVDLDAEAFDLEGTEIPDLSQIGKVYTYEEVKKLLSDGVAANYGSLSSGGAEKALTSNTTSPKVPSETDDIEARMKAALQGH